MIHFKLGVVVPVRVGANQRSTLIRALTRCYGHDLDLKARSSATRCDKIMEPWYLPFLMHHMKSYQTPTFPPFATTSHGTY